MPATTRRHFLALSSGLLVGCRPADPPPTPAVAPTDAATDVLVVGGTCGGAAAALAACRAGAKRVIVTEESDWLGGQLTAQLVPPDENQWIESGGANRSYRDYREAVRRHYRTAKDRPLKPAYRDRANLNPGNCWVSRIGHEPKVGVAVLDRMLQPYLASGQLVVHRRAVPVSAAVAGDRVEAVTFRDTKDGTTFTVTARYVIDATDEGDLLPLAKAEFVTGTESQKETGEPHAADRPRPGNVQSFNWCFILEHRDGERHVIDKPREYEFWRPRFNWDNYSFYPKADKDPKRTEANFWTYRRVIDARMFANCKGDVSVVNWHHNDYDLGCLHTSTPEQVAKHRDRARQMSLSLAYWLQTESPRSDGGEGWPGLRLCPEQTGTTDGLAMAPYIRESRRIKALFTVLEQHVSRAIREAELGKEKARAEVFPDSVGVGHYLYIDIHKTCEGYSNGGGGKVFPFQIPLGALVPVRVRNLLAGCKNLGVTHLTNGCYRLHPIEWGVGEAAGALAAFCLATGAEPRQVRETPGRLAAFQKQLADAGVLLEWPADAARGG
jgi:hypothetical protein